MQIHKQPHATRPIPECFDFSMITSKTRGAYTQVREHVERSKRAKACILNRFQAFSLIEVLVAIGVLAMTLGGLAASLIMATQAAQTGLRRNVAYNAAQMYLGQILSMPDTTFLRVLENPTKASFPTISIQTDYAGNKTLLEDPLNVNYIGQLPGQSGTPVQLTNNNNIKQFPFRRRLSPTKEVTVDTLEICYTLYVTDLSTLSSPVKGYAIVLNFTYEVPYLHNEQKTLSGRVFGLKPFDA